MRCVASKRGGGEGFPDCLLGAIMSRLFALHAVIYVELGGVDAVDKSGSDKCSRILDFYAPAPVAAVLVCYRPVVHSSA
jgi:hypothetical protein